MLHPLTSDGIASFGVLAVCVGAWAEIRDRYVFICVWARVCIWVFESASVGGFLRMDSSSGVTGPGEKSFYLQMIEFFLLFRKRSFPRYIYVCLPTKCSYRVSKVEMWWDIRSDAHDPQTHAQIYMHTRKHPNTHPSTHTHTQLGVNERSLSDERKRMRVSC